MSIPEFRYFTEPEKQFLSTLPLDKPLEEWTGSGVNLIEFRKGLSRHEVIFVHSPFSSYAVKQTTAVAAINEFNLYIKLLEKGVHTLTPAGCIVYDPVKMLSQSKIGLMAEESSRALFFSRLERESLPEAYLLSLPFTEKNKKRILDSAALLLATLHSKGIYWGDASVSNLLIKFVKIKDELGRVKTVLKALLADAETVQINPALSKEMRKDEVLFLCESIEWFSEELFHQGKIKRRITLAKDKQFLLNQYNTYYRLLRMNEVFYTSCGIETFRYFGFVKDSSLLQLLKKQIDEHKWYLSEKSGRIVSLRDAASDWLSLIYLPTIERIKELRIYEFFPFKTAGELYNDLMKHKYYLSERAGFDVGIEQTVEDFVSSLPKSEKALSFMQKLQNIFHSIFRNL